MLTLEYKQQEEGVGKANIYVSAAVFSPYWGC